MASCRKWILNIHSFTIWIKNEQLPVDHTFWWPTLRKKFHEIFTLVWEAISTTRASGFIRGSKHLETIKALGRSGLVLSSVSRCLEPLIKPSHSLLIYYVINFEEKKTFSYYIAMSFLSFFLTEICKLSRKSKELGPRKFFIVYQNAEMSNYDFLQKSVSQVFFHLMDSPSVFLVQAGLMHPV